MSVERHYSAKEVQKMLQISKSTLYRLQKKGCIVPARVGRQRRFPESKIQDLLNGRCKDETKTEEQSSEMAAAQLP